MSRLHERVWPNDCSFLLAVPTEEKDFYADLKDGGKDFVRSHYGAARLSAEDKWGAYKATADDLETLLVQLGRRHVRVVPRATLQDWVRAQEVSKVIVLFAHWRSGLLKPFDVDWTLLDKFVPNSPRGEMIQNVVTTIRTEAAGDRTEVVKRLNEILLNGQLGEHPWFGNQPNQKPASGQHRIYANRKFLDEAFPRVFGLNACVEFADRLVPLEEIAGATRKEYSGIFDMSICNSILLAELVKIPAPGCLVVATQLPAMVDFRVVFYDALFKLLKRGRPYIAEMENLRKQIVQMQREGK